MTEPVTPWAEHQRSEWARLEAVWSQREQHAITEADWNRTQADELRAPQTDEEPWARPLDREIERLPRRRDARLVLLAFAGMGAIALLAWAVQR